MEGKLVINLGYIKVLDFIFYNSVMENIYYNVNQ